MRYSLLLILALVAATAFAQTPAKSDASANPWIGAWKLDTAASKMHAPAPKQQTVNITAAGHDGTAFNIEGTDADGKAYTLTYVSTADGKEAPEMMDGKKTGMSSYKMVDDNTVSGEGETTDGAKWTMNATLSEDKQTMTAVFHRTPANGEPYDETEVYKK